MYFCLSITKYFASTNLYLSTRFSVPIRYFDYLQYNEWDIVEANEFQEMVFGFVAW